MLNVYCASMSDLYYYIYFFYTQYYGSVALCQIYIFVYIYIYINTHYYIDMINICIYMHLPEFGKFFFGV